VPDEVLLELLMKTPSKSTHVPHEVQPSRLLREHDMAVVGGACDMIQLGSAAPMISSSKAVAEWQW
jgi:hypothetical protein